MRQGRLPRSNSLVAKTGRGQSLQSPAWQELCYPAPSDPSWAREPYRQRHPCQLDLQAKVETPSHCQQIMQEKHTSYALLQSPSLEPSGGFARSFFHQLGNTRGVPFEV